MVEQLEVLLGHLTPTWVHGAFVGNATVPAGGHGRNYVGGGDDAKPNQQQDGSDIAEGLDPPQDIEEIVADYRSDEKEQDATEDNHASGHLDPGLYPYPAKQCHWPRGTEYRERQNS
jgi:hypothetical protein